MRDDERDGAGREGGRADARGAPAARAGGGRVYDVAVVGGGPAGLSAALWLARYLHSVVLVDSGDPRNWETRGVNGYLGLPDIRPAELRGRGREECRRYGVELVDGFVSRVRKEGDERFVLEYDPIESTKAEEDRRGPGAPRAPEANEPRSATRTVAGRRLVLAFGLKDEWPRVSGLRQVYGETAHVCPDCDGYETRGKTVVVIANGRKAVGMALALTTWTGDIVVCTNGEPPDFTRELKGKLDALGVPVLAERIERVNHRDGRCHSVTLADGRQVPCDEIFFALSQRPADDLGAQLGCERDEEGRITVMDGAYHTSVPNVYAAGDIVPGPQLALVAAADGAIAALAIHKSLLPEERRLS